MSFSTTRQALHLKNNDWDADNVIPEVIWDVVNEKRVYNKKRSRAANTTGVWIRKFHYNVPQEAWGGDCGCIQQQNLFFEYITSVYKDSATNGGNSIHDHDEMISEDFISVQFGDNVRNNNSYSFFQQRHSSNTNTHNEEKYSTSSPNLRTYYYQADKLRERMLRNGLTSPKGDHFQLLGCSNSQVRNYSFLFRRVHKNSGSTSRSNTHTKKSLKRQLNVTIQSASAHFHRLQNMTNEQLLTSILPNLTQLEQKKGVSKRVKYTGLLFSGIKCFVNLPQSTLIRRIGSIENNGFDFTDGVGLISIKLAREITKQLLKKGKNGKKQFIGMMKKNEVPSVFQIRYGGAIQQCSSDKDDSTDIMKPSTMESYVCKGVLLVDPTEEDEYILSFRSSMQKIQLSDNNNQWGPHMNHILGIVDYSTPKVGKLNQQVTCLLSANVPNEILLEIQQNHLHQIRNCWSDPTALGYMAAMEEEERFWDLYQELILNDSWRTEYDRLPSAYISLAQRRPKYCNDSGKLQIHLGQSRTVFGTAFPEYTHKLLEENQCFFFTDQGLLVHNSIIVSRSPSYTPGDVRVLSSINLPVESPLRQLRNCILFSTCGSRPTADKMSGGDLDGDQYLVIWDERLTKYADKIRQEEVQDYFVTMDIPAVSDISGQHPPPKEDWIAYCSKFDNSILGIVDRAFYATAKEKGITSRQAKELNQIFTSLVDKNPASLESLERLIGSSYLSGKDDIDSNGSCCVWESMLMRQMECGEEIRTKVIPDQQEYSIFRQRFLNHPTNIVNNIKSFHGYFHANIKPEKLKSFMEDLNKMYVKRLKSTCVNGKDQSATTTTGSTEDSLNSQFYSMYKVWEKNARDVFYSALEDWDKKRQELLQDMKTERFKLDSQLAELDRMRTKVQNVTRSKEKELLTIDVEYAEQATVEHNRLLVEIKLLQKKMQGYLQQLDILKQNMLELIRQEIERLNIQDKMHIVRMNDKQENLRNRRWTVLSFIGFDAEGRAMTKTINELQDQRDKISTVLVKVQDQEEMLESGVLVKMTEFDSKELKLLSTEYKSCGEQLNAIFKMGNDTKKLIQIHKRSMQEMEWLATELRSGRWRSAYTISCMKDFTTSNLEFLARFDLEGKWNLARREMTTKQVEQHKVEMDLNALDERRDGLLNGNLWSEIDFEVKKKKVELKDKRKEYGHARQVLIEATSRFEDMEKNKQSSQSKLAMYEDDMSSRYQLKDKFESFLDLESTKQQLNYFDNQMMSQSSYHTLQALARRYGKTDPFWAQIDQVFFLDEKDSVLSGVIEENQDALHSFFQNANEAQQRVQIESELRVADKTRQSKNLEEKKLFLHQELDEIKSRKSSLQADCTIVLADQKKLNKLIKGSKRKGKQTPHNTMDGLLARKESLMDKRNRLQLDIDAASIVMKKRQQDLLSLQQELLQNQNKFKAFSKRCKTFRSKAKVFLDGELVGCLPSVVFTKVKDDIIAMIDGLSNLKKAYNQQEVVKAKGIQHYFGDRDIFVGYRLCMDNTRNMYSSQSLHQLQQKIDEECDTHKSLALKMSYLNQEIKMHQGDSHRLTEEVKNSEADLNSLESKLRKTYCKQRMEELQKRWDDKGWEDSLNCAITLINRTLEEVKSNWNQTIDSSDKLQAMDRKIQRMIDIEENRIIGFPKRNGERSGCMPVYDKRAELQKALKESDIVIITAGTGCGKSTQLPQYIVDDFYAHTHIYQEQRDFFRICCTQPRRLAAQGVAARVAEEYMTSLGDMVGFRVGKRGNVCDSQKVSKNTRIEFVTEGLLLHQLTKSAENIKNYDCIIIDEAHERNKETDLLLARLRRFLNESQYTMKVVVMSATIDPTQFSEYFGGCPILNCPGRNFHVEEYFKPAPLNRVPEKKGGMIDIEHVINVLFDTILKQYGTSTNFEEGDVLIFLSSAAQITLCVDKINDRARKQQMPYVVAYALFAQMPEKDKEAAKDPNHRTGISNGMIYKVTNGNHEFSRKVICCTNIAETSLTIDRVRFVIEGGYAKKPMYDHHIRSKAIYERMISQASAKQRKGRAGRTAPGRCYYLYSESDLLGREPYDVPQIKDIPVDELIMYSLNICGESIEHLGLIDCPETTHIDAAKERLSDLEMIKIKKCGSIGLTKDGKIACRLSLLDPQAVRMILSARMPGFNCLHKAIKLGAVLSSEESIFLSFGKTDVDYNDEDQELISDHDLGDHFLALITFEKFEENKKSGFSDRQMRKWCKNQDLIYYVLERIQNTVEQSYKEMKKFKYLQLDNSSTPSPQRMLGNEDECLLRALISGYFSQIGEYCGPTFLTQMGFSMLSSAVDHNPRLAKESCLYKYLTDVEFEDEDSDNDDSDDDTANEYSEKDDPNDEAEVEDGKLELNLAKKEFQRTAANFVIHTDMFSIELKNKQKLVLIPRVSLIHGKWIREHAPESWCHRVSFDENKPTISRRSVLDIGRDFQLAALNLYRTENFKDNLRVVLQILWSSNKLILYGKIEPLNDVVYKIETLIANIKEKKMKKDFINYYQDASQFGPGMKINKIRNKEAKDGFTAKQAWKKSHEETPPYWYIKGQGSQHVIVFVNEGNDSSIFCKILQRFLPPQDYKCKPTIGQIQITPIHDEQRPLLNIVKDTINAHSNVFSPVTLSISSIVNSSKKSEIPSSVKQLLEEMSQSLEYEWMSCIPFWRKLCEDMEELVPKSQVKAKYSPVTARFEIFSTKDCISEKVKTELTGRLIKMCKPENIRQHKPELTKISKRTLWRIAAVVGEVRLKFPLIRFTLIIMTSPNSSSDDDIESDESSTIITDVKRLLQFDDKEDFILKTISIRIQCSSSPNNMMIEAMSILDKELPSKAQDEIIKLDDTTLGIDLQRKRTATPKCHLCKRKLRFEAKHKKKKNVDSDNNELNKAGFTAGYKLDLCGCAFCRECFCNSMLSSLKTRGLARCSKCDTIVLARDCNDITNATYWKMEKNDKKRRRLHIQKFEADWKHLATMSYQSYCSKFVELMRSKAFTTCKNCASVMLHDININAIYCSNMKCGRLILAA